MSPEKGQPGLVRAALFALCPVCGASGVFAGPAMLVPRCRGCATGFAAHELSGRVLYPVILPLVIVLVLAALRLDDALRPPLWVHALIWPPVVAVVIIGALRLVKLAWVMRGNPPRNGEGDHAQHAGTGASLHGLHHEALPLHHPAGGPPPRSGEE